MLQLSQGSVATVSDVGEIHTFSTGHFYPRDASSSAGITCRRVSYCPSVRLSQVSVLLKRINVGSRKQRHTIAPGTLDF